MAGSFGYMKETVEVSKKMASLDLVPAIENAEPDTTIVARELFPRVVFNGGGGSFSMAEYCGFF